MSHPAIENALRTVARGTSLRASGQWLLRAIEQGSGGVSARWKLRRGWLPAEVGATAAFLGAAFDVSPYMPELGLTARSRELGRWLLERQRRDGSFLAPKDAGRNVARERGAGERSSVIETGRALRAFLALAEGAPGEDSRGEGSGEDWSGAARRAAQWLLARAEATPELPWQGADVLEGEGPSTLAEPLSDLARAARSTLLGGPLADGCGSVVERGTRALVARATAADSGGALTPWEGGARRGVGCRSIAVALEGLLACAGVAGVDVERALAPTCRHLIDWSEERHGLLPAAVDDRWNVLDDRTDPGANAAAALALLSWHRRTRDERALSAARALIDGVCAAQIVRHPVAALRGAVGERAPRLAGAIASSGTTLGALFLVRAVIAHLEATQASLSSNATAASTEPSTGPSIGSSIGSAAA